LPWNYRIERQTRTREEGPIRPKYVAYFCNGEKKGELQHKLLVDRKKYAERTESNAMLQDSISFSDTVSIH
jgi:hypothetical protein